MKRTKLVLLLAVVSCEKTPSSTKHSPRSESEVRSPKSEVHETAPKAPRPSLSAVPRTLPNDRPAPGNVQGRFTVPVEKP